MSESLEKTTEQIHNRSTAEVGEDLDLSDKCKQVVDNAPDNDFIEFLQYVVAQSPERHNLSQYDIDLLMKRSMSIIESDSAGYELTVSIHQSFELDHAYRRKNKKDESITDKAFRACIKYYADFPKAGKELMDFFGQEFTVRPDIVIDALVEAHNNPDLFEDLFQSLLYLFAFGAEVYENLIIERLDFENYENMRATGIFLECIARLYTVSADTSYAEGNSGRLLDVIRKAVEEERGSYYLNLRAKYVLSLLERGYEHGAVRLGRNNSLINQDQGLTKDEIDDLSYLESANISRLIKADLGINIGDLDLAEQRYFLTFSKRKNVNEIRAISRFYERFGKNGMSTFLSLQYDRSLGDKIIEFSEDTDPEVVNKVFAKYSSLIDSSRQIEDYMRDVYGIEVTADVIDKIRRRLTKKAADILKSFIENSDKGSGRTLLATSMMERLDDINTDALVLANTFKVLHRSRSLDVTEISDVSLDRYANPNEIPELIKAELLRIFRENRAKGIYPHKLAEASEADFEKVLRFGNCEFYLLTFKEIGRASCRERV